MSEETIDRYRASSNPASDAIKFMYSRNIRMQDLYESLELLQHEEGLLFLNKPYESMQLIRQPKQLITVQRGETLEVACEAHGFPMPTFAYYKNNVKLSDGSLFKKTFST